ncbi:acyltransferase [Roseateles sp.]|uniref:acyltransferase family protein n=1 Tax=Roseateles sp. TaxID=1971397 RepID=UPI00326795C5
MTRGVSPGRFDASVDVARASLMLYVVAYLHLGGYVGDGDTHVGWASAAITQCVLGTFTFISGYLLGRHPLKLEAAAWLAFYRQRFWRIYPLYLVALACFAVTGLTDWRTATKAALGLTMFFPPSPMTLWYVAMLMACIAVAPALLIGTRKTTLLVSAAVLLFLAGWQLCIAPLDTRLATQFAAFASGIVVARSHWRYLPVGWGLLTAAGLALALQLSTTSRGDLSDWSAIPAVCLMPLLVLRALDALPAQVGSNRLVRMLSYGSFCAYLFHRVVYGAFERLMHFDQPLHHWLALLCLALPAVMAVAVLAQYLYDRLFLSLSGLRTSSS